MSKRTISNFTLTGSHLAFFGFSLHFIHYLLLSNQNLNGRIPISGNFDKYFGCISSRCGASYTCKNRNTQHKRKGSQKYLFLSLSLTELFYCLISITHLWCKEYSVRKSIRKHITIFRRIAVLLMYYFLMIYIALERFAAIYLNIKYRVY